MILSFFSNLYRTIFNLPRFRPLNEILAAYAHSRKNVTFIQIGSNDGVTDDPLNEHIVQNHWRGILVEPVPYLYKKLKNNYALSREQLEFENAAISTNDGSMSFFRIQETKNATLPIWYDQLGSFYKNVVLSHKEQIPHLEEYIIEEKVTTITFNSLIKKYGIAKVQLIHIDTEGYDAEILRQINFKTMQCEMVIFEHKHLTPSSYKQCLKILKDNNFKLFWSEGDTIGVNKTILKKIRLLNKPFK